MKILVVGFGKMGMLHAATLRALPGIDEVVLAEHSPLVLAAVGVFSPETRIGADHRAWLGDASIRAAVIATPTATHGPLYRELAPRMDGLFVEKPFAVSAADAEAAIAACPPGRRPASMTGHCLRFAMPFREAARLLDSGALGPIRSFDAGMYSSDVVGPSGRWRFKSAAEGGGVLLDLGSHVIDMVRSFFGVPRSLTARTESLVTGASEDRFESTWTYADFAGTVRGSWSEPGYRKATLVISVTGENGTLEVSDDGVEFELATRAAELDAGRHLRSITELERAVPFDLAGPMYTRQLAAWLDALRGAPAGVGTLEENLANLRLIDAIRASGGRPVSLEPAA